MYASNLFSQISPLANIRTYYAMHLCRLVRQLFKQSEIISRHLCKLARTRTRLLTADWDISDRIFVRDVPTDSRATAWCILWCFFPLCQFSSNRERERERERDALSLLLKYLHAPWYSFHLNFIRRFNAQSMSIRVGNNRKNRKQIVNGTEIEETELDWERSRGGRFQASLCRVSKFTIKRKYIGRASSFISWKQWFFSLLVLDAS